MLSNKVSIIIATLNSEKNLSACLYSIVNQTFTNIEICIIDGLSTDNTVSIIKTFADKYINIKYLSEKDNGIYNALNKGIIMSTGNWLYFLGSDDQLTSNSLLAEIFDNTLVENTDLIYGNIIGLQSQKKIITDNENVVLSEGISHQSIFFSRCIFADLGLYNEFFKISADYDLVLKVFLSNKYKKRYINKFITYFGEQGVSSTSYDYVFYSGHYKVLAKHNGLNKIKAPQQCLEKSIYCCFIIAKEKKELLFAWSNILYYIFHKNELTITERIKTFLRMCYWTICSPNKPNII